MALTTKQIVREQLSIIFRGRTAQPHSEEWRSAVEAFQNNADQADFSELFFSDLSSAKNFINSMTTNTKDKQAKAKLSASLEKMLSQRHVFNRIAHAGNEEILLPWIEFIKPSSQRLSVLIGTDFIPALFRKSGAKPYIERTIGIIDKLNKADLKTLLSDEKITYALRAHIPQDKRANWLERTKLENLKL